MVDSIRDNNDLDVRHDGRNPALAGRETQWERSVLEKLTGDLVEERRKSRRWGMFFKLLTLAYIAGISFYLINAMNAGKDGAADPAAGSTGHTAVVDLNGVIKADSDNSAEAINKSLRRAFKHAGTKGVVLRINSPGGSPVQSGLIFEEIRRLREKHSEIPMYAVVEEICASGGYYVAAAADKIFVDRSSLVGSIGVLMDGFGFVGTMNKLGVERRLFTAGADKGFLDPFSPLADDQRDHLQSLLDSIHEQFIEAVRTGRGEKLKNEAELFSGLIWTGAQSIELGLADAVGSVERVARDEVKSETLVNFTSRKTLLERLAERFGFSLGAAVVEPLENGWGGLQLR